MDDLERAERRLKGAWPKDPHWIFTSPDHGKHVYRSMRSDVCPDCFLDTDGKPFKQLYSIDNKIVGKDIDYGKLHTGGNDGN